MSEARALHDDLDELRALLTADAERLAETLLGPPTKGLSTKKTLRFGKNGSLAVELRGHKRGEWFSHETGTGGGLFDLIGHAHGCRFPDAVRWARTWLGAAVDAPRPKPRAVPDRTQADAEEQAERAKAIRTARSMAQAAEPIGGTIAETYLVNGRAIPMPPDGWPDCIRYHAATRSLLAIATTADGAVQAVQRVRLTPSGHKAEGTPAEPVKVTNGRQDGAMVRLPERPDVMPALQGVLQLAEGPENGLSVWAATGCETWFIFGVGQFSKIELPAGRRAVLCRDDDRMHSPADKAVRAAVSTWRTVGHDVAIASPWADRRGDKSDFNDALQACGVLGVLARILPHAPKPRPPSIVRVPVEEARRQVDCAVRAFFAEAAAFDADQAKAEGVAPPVHGVRVSVGVGKSHAARHCAVEMVAEMRRRGDRRTVVLAVPTHRLGAEQATLLEELPALRAAALTVAVWRGRTAADPDHADFANPNVPDDDKPAMCGNLDDVFDAQSHGLNVDQTACKRSVKSDDGKEKVVYECPLYARCAYQKQRKRRADIWLVAHKMLYTSKPKTIGDVAAIVVDESAWHAALEGVNGRGDRMPLDALRNGDRRLHDETSADWLTLQHHRRRALDALEKMPLGAITRESIEVEGLTVKDAAEARALELNRIIDPKIHPGMPRVQKIALLKLAENNKAILQRVRFWRATEALLADGGPAASGWAGRGAAETPDGPVEVVQLRRRQPVGAGWQVPTLLIDALFSIELVCPIWPQVIQTADVEAETPHQHIRQVIDRAYSKSRLEPLDEAQAMADPAEARRRIRNLREARAIAFRVARQHRGGRVLVVAQEAAQKALEALGPLPRNLVLAHHNGVAGMDEWGDVSALVVIGRTAPPPVDVERMAEALTGAAVAGISGWYPRAPAMREKTAGARLAAETDAHPDSVCEAIRWQVCEGEVLQIIGRGRGVNRTASNPLHVLAMTDAPLSTPIDQAIGADELEPTESDRMVAECGFAFETPRHAAAACPGLWATWEAAKKALERDAAKWGKKGTNPYKNISIGDCPLLPPEQVRIDYRRSGQGQGDAVAWFCPLMVADPAAELARLLGPLAWCSVAPVPPDPGSRATAGPIVVPVEMQADEFRAAYAQAREERPASEGNETGVSTRSAPARAPVRDPINLDPANRSARAHARGAVEARAEQGSGFVASTERMQTNPEQPKEQAEMIKPVMRVSPDALAEFAGPVLGSWIIRAKPGGQPVCIVETPGAVRFAGGDPPSAAIPSAAICAQVSTVQARTVHGDHRG